MRSDWESEFGYEVYLNQRKETYMSDLKTIKVAGEIFYAQDMTKFNTTFNPDNDRYICTLGQLSDKAVEALSEIGVKVKTPKGTNGQPLTEAQLAKGKHITAKSKYIFEPVDEQGNKVDPTKIGNGTKVVAILSSYTHKMSKMYGNSPSIKKLIVTELKEYTPEVKAEAVEAEDVL